MADQPPRPPKRRSFGFWAAVALVMGGVLYPLSFGPACWISSRLHHDKAYAIGVSVAETISVAYRPILYAMNQGVWCESLETGYASLCAPNDIRADLQAAGDNNILVLSWTRYPTPYSDP